MAKVGRPKKIYQTPPGMHDLLPEDWVYFQKIFNVVEDVANFYGFFRIETPILEPTELFEKGIGLTTDIIEKQMYNFRTKGGDCLSLRPEGTAPIVRSYIQQGMQNLLQPVKLWHYGPFFRYEHPQAGRYRQFWQFGFEIFGEENPIIDAQLIQIFYNILKELKFRNLIIEVNSIGCPSCRAYYKKLLVSYFKGREVSLCADCRRRLRDNPLRILDCKEEKCQPTKSQAPQIIDHLCEGCHHHFKEVLEFLDELELPYHLNPYLVRGLDYYTKTVFEIFLETKKENEDFSRVALLGGGRYDNLVKVLGGKETPACGGAAGIERIVELIKKEQIRFRTVASQPKVFLAQLGPLAKRKSLKLFEGFREAGISAAESFGRDSLKAQLRIADRLGVKFTLILGQKEALEGTVIIREMATGKQEVVKLDKAVREIRRRIKK
jgi:histidyl-tRNA synthetase